LTTSLRWIVAGTLISIILGGVGFVYFDKQTASWHLTPATLPESASSNTDTFAPLPFVVLKDQPKVALGKRLFNEPKLSGNASVSCAHCHNLATGGVDRAVSSRGIDGKEGRINAPTVFNSSMNFRQFWDGRADSLEDQIDGPLNNPLEMGSSWPQAVTALSNDPQYKAEFAVVYRDGITPHNIKDAIATFERSLITPDSRFDRYLRGDHSAMNEEELAGLHLFKKIGCTSCHQGVNIGGNMFQKLGIMEDYFAARGNISLADQGRFNVTQKEEDRYFFRVPSLRNVALTPPYLHDGSAKTLDQAVKIMGRYQLGKELDEPDTRKIVAFLRSLTGNYLGQPLQ